MAAKSSSNHGSEMLKQEDLSSQTTSRKVPTTRRKKVLFERLVNAQYVLQSNVDVKPELANEEQAQEISSIRRKAKSLQMDLDDLIRESYLQLRNQIDALIAEENIEEELRSWKGLLDVIDKAVDFAHEYLSNDSKVEDQSSQESRYTESHQSSNLKQPRIELPKFNGDVLKFQNFWDQFEAAVHNNDDLPNVQKFTYLRSVLTRNASQTIGVFELTGANYQPNYQHRYERKRVIMPSLVKAVIKMDAKSSISASSLRDHYNTLKEQN